MPGREGIRSRGVVMVRTVRARQGIAGARGDVASDKLGMFLLPGRNARPGKLQGAYREWTAFREGQVRTGLRLRAGRALGCHAATIQEYRFI